MALIKLVVKNFMVCRKSAKTAKVFFRVGFVVYDICTYLAMYVNMYYIYTSVCIYACMSMYYI